LAARKYAIYTWPSSVQYCRRMKIWSPAHWEHGKYETQFIQDPGIQPVHCA
jgi:hypothetical protein